MVPGTFVVRWIAAVITIAFGFGCVTMSVAFAGDTSVVTYHNDTNRTGWNRQETTLTTTNVSAATFGMLAAVPLDAQVDAQPLILSHQMFTSTAVPGVYDLAYVVTENDSVYAVDAATGNVLARRNLGTPVPSSPCNNNAPIIGITSTPVIDREKEAMYVMAYTYENGVYAYHLHALSLRTLVDLTKPALVTASRTLANGTVATLLPKTNRQRAALLEANGTIYAGFSSFCDQDAELTRGWVLGWNAKTLAPLPTNELTDTLALAHEQFYLDSVWMSGAGIAADESGSIYYTTSNSWPTSYDGVNDIQESFIRQSNDLSHIQGLFTPSNQSSLDSVDGDFGSGGVLLVPYQATGTVPHIGMAAGKDGNLYVVNRDALGGYSPNANNVLGTYAIGGCWCAPSYFVGADNVPRVVTSGGNNVGVWTLQTTPSVSLTEESQSPPIASGEDPGFFTSVSSNGTKAGTAIAWAVGRPTSDNPAVVTLYAFDASNASKTLYSAVAGTWPHTNANANVVPVVANGRVFVASEKQLAIFGLLGAVSPWSRIALAAPAERALPLSANQHEIYGRIESLSGTQFVLRTRYGRIFRIDAGTAIRAFRTTTLYRGEFVVVRTAATTAQGFVAATVARAKSSTALWAPDR